MNKKYEELRAKAYAALRALSRECEDYREAQMLVGSAETEASLRRRTVRRSIDTEWVERIEAAMPALDAIIRRPTVAIEDVEEILPIELTRRVSEKSIKHLARHTDMIREVKGDEVIPSRLLNVFREETLLTYENRFINTLLHRLSAFITIRYRALAGGSGVEENYCFEYKTEFEHPTEGEAGVHRARVGLTVELTSPPSETAKSEAEAELCARYRATFARIEKLHLAVLAYLSSPFAQALGRSFVRPPVIRTNAILKNQHFKSCLLLWEYIEGCDKAGYSMSSDAYAEMPSSPFVSDLYSAVALEYAEFFHGVAADDAERKLLASKHVGEIYPDFSSDLSEEELEDYRVYDSEYKKTVPVSRLMNNKKKLSEDERRIREAMIVALRADELLTADLIAAENEARRLAEERRAAEAERKKREAAAQRDPIAVRYKRSYLARLIQSDDALKENYSAIKNALLAYERVRASLSFRGESFRRGRETLAALNILGKTLYLTLDLPLETYGKKHFVSPSGKDAMPLLVKVRNERSLTQALRLIAEMMKGKGIALTDRTPEDYRPPYEETEALIERGLIKVILPKGVVKDEYDTLVRADIPSMIGPRSEPIAAPEAPEAEAEIEDEPETPEAEPVAVRYKRSFSARLIQGEDALKDNYNAVKNALLAYERVRASLSFRGESFRRGRETLAALNILGKTLYLTLDLPLETYGKKHFVSPSGKDAMPLLVKVRNERSLTQALRLIAEMMKGKGIALTDRTPEDYRPPYEETEALIERGLVKVIAPKGVSLGDATVAADVSALFAPPAPPAAPEAPVEAAVMEDAPEAPEAEPVAVRYKRSYLARLIQGEDALKDNYNAVKNALLAYERVRASLSFRGESFRRGRETLAALNILGKTLYLTLDLPLGTYGKKHFVSPSGKDAMPLLVKVRSERSLTQALRLIAEMMKGKGIALTDRTPEDYRPPYEETEALIERGLIKVIAPKGISLGDATVAADVSALFAPSAAPEAPVEAAVMEDAPEAPVEADTVTAVSEAEVEAEAEIEAEPVAVRYKRSFSARLIQGEDALKDNYNAVKNALLAYERVRTSLSFRGESFRRGRETLAALNILGKTLYLTLDLPLETYGKKHFVSPSGKDAMPLLVKVRSERSLTQALRLIAEMMKGKGIALTDRTPEDYRPPYEETEALIERGLIKVIAPKGISLGDATVAADVSALFASPAAPEAPVEAAVMEDAPEAEALATETEAPAPAPEAPAAEPLDDGTGRIGIERSVAAEEVDLCVLEVGDVAVIHEVDSAMIEAFGTELFAVRVSETPYVGHTLIKIRLDPIPVNLKKRLRPRIKNLVFTDSAATVGLFVPYTRAAYLALPRKERKQVFLTAVAIAEYNCAASRLALLHHLEDERYLEQLSYYEERCRTLSETLPTEPAWEKWIKAL